jgi:hypothetical protein
MDQAELYKYVKDLQLDEFGDIFDRYELCREDDGKHFFFAPSSHCTMYTPLFTPKMLADLQENAASMLSVGAGPAYLEELLVRRMGVNKSQITLADISGEYIPSGYVFYQFDMHQEWPEFDKEFNYVILPESSLINVNFDDRTIFDGDDIKQPNREVGFYNLLIRGLQVLAPKGEVRVSGGVSPVVSKPVNDRIKSEFPNVEVTHSGELTWLIKHENYTK